MNLHQPAVYLHTAFLLLAMLACSLTTFSTAPQEPAADYNSKMPADSQTLGVLCVSVCVSPRPGRVCVVCCGMEFVVLIVSSVEQPATASILIYSQQLHDHRFLLCLQLTKHNFLQAAVLQLFAGCDLQGCHQLPMPNHQQMVFSRKVKVSGLWMLLVLILSSLPVI